MSAQPRFPSRKLRRVLLATVLSVFAMGVAVPAASATLVITPIVTGSGELRPNGDPGILCQQGVLLNTTSLTCAAPPLINSNWDAICATVRPRPIMIRPWLPRCSPVAS